MSGGGSRAANFSSAVLLELDDLRILPKAAVISSVSGSSLTNAYYARWGRSPERSRYWTEKELRRRMGEDLQTRWEVRWFYPQNIVKYWTTDFDRSDIMKEIFDETLFNGTNAKFVDMGPRQCDTEMRAVADQPVTRPVVLLNATTLAGSNFVFTDEDFKRALNSRLETYPISHAIMASAAFPGAFQNVTLENYNRTKHYQHLFDGGPSDNLGVEALEKTLHQLDLQTQHGGAPIKGCMLILVDSFADTAQRNEAIQSGRSDTRRNFDFIVSDNFDNAFDALLAHRREDTLESLNLQFDSPEDIGKVAIWSYQPFRLAGNGPNADLTCHVWHLTFQRLRHLTSVQEANKIADDVNGIKTAFRLGSFFGRNKDQQQDALYKAAHILTHDDSKTLETVLQLFKKWGFNEDR